MGEACTDCSKWEEDMYWTHFQIMHFCQFLHGDDFRNCLGIPRKFANRLKDKLPESVTLKGPSGVKWTVGIVRKNDTLFFEHGWQEFVEDHSLEENDMLIFKYFGNSCFDVLIIDQETLCEKVSSYFVRKCGHRKAEGETASQSKRKAMDVEDNETSFHDEQACTSQKKAREDHDARQLTSGRHATVQANGNAQSDVGSDAPVDTPVLPTRVTSRAKRKTRSAIGSVTPVGTRVLPKRTSSRATGKTQGDISSDAPHDASHPPAETHSIPGDTTLQINGGMQSDIGSDALLIATDDTLLLNMHTTPRDNVNGLNDISSDTPVIAPADASNDDHPPAPFPVPNDDSLNDPLTAVPENLVGAVSVTPDPLRSKRGRKPSAKVVLAKADTEGGPGSPNASSYHLQYVSNRRIITEEEKEKTLQMAQAAATEQSIAVVMRPSHVYKRFFISLPSDWARKHELIQNYEVILRVNDENSWRVRYYYNTPRNSGAFSSGWKDFAVDNNLEEYDVCLFQMASQVEGVLLMDVKIFRVVEDVTPLTRASTPMPSKGKYKKSKSSSRKSRRGPPTKLEIRQ